MATTTTEKKKPNYNYMRDKDRESVKGVFRFFEVPGGTMSFVYKAYKGEPVQRFDFIDGQIYTVPLGVAKHLNKNGWYPVHSFMQDEHGNYSQKIGQRVRRFGFQSLEFMDIEGMNEHISPIVTVELTGL